MNVQNRISASNSSPRHFLPTPFGNAATERLKGIKESAFFQKRFVKEKLYNLSEVLDVIRPAAGPGAG
jgi:hypothetical protein